MFLAKFFFWEIPKCLAKKLFDYIFWSCVFFWQSGTPLPAFAIQCIQSHVPVHYHADWDSSLGYPGGGRPSLHEARSGFVAAVEGNKLHVGAHLFSLV